MTPRNVGLILIMMMIILVDNDHGGGDADHDHDVEDHNDDECHHNHKYCDDSCVIVVITYFLPALGHRLILVLLLFYLTIGRLAVFFCFLIIG